MRRGGMTSITSQVHRSVTSIAVLLSVPAVIGLVVMLIYSSQTQALIRRMDAAAGMKPALESTIADNLFSVSAGIISFEDSNAEELIAETDRTLDTLLAETEGNGHLQLTTTREGTDLFETQTYEITRMTLDSLYLKNIDDPSDTFEYGRYKPEPELDLGVDFDYDSQESYDLF